MVRSIPDRRFERAGADLWRTEKLPVADAVLGITLQVPQQPSPQEQALYRQLRALAVGSP